jgi:linoleoyl-CoA desaturase
VNTRILFPKNQADDLHFKNLKFKVENEVNALPKSRKNWARFKAFLLPTVYFGLYAASLVFYNHFWLYFFIYALMGLSAVLIFLNLVHEAVHGALFKRKWQNQMILYLFDLLGANSYIWKKRHKVLHHSFQNIAGWDSDIEQASLFRIYPHDKIKRIHTIQHWLIFVFYPLYLINWVFVRDFKDYFIKKQVIRKVVKIPGKEYAKLFLFKALFIFYLSVIPILVGVNVGQAIGAMFFMILVAGSSALLTLLTPHVNTTNQFPLADINGLMKLSWLEHQFATTNDVDLNNWLSRNILGNFNFHIAHHLFPNISYVYAPEVTGIIAKYASKHDLDYRSYPLKKALNLHYQLIKQNANRPDLFEEDM